MVNLAVNAEIPPSALLTPKVSKRQNKYKKLLNIKGPRDCRRDTGLHLVRGTGLKSQETTEVLQREDLAQDLHLHLKEQQQMSQRMGANQQVMRWMIR